MPAAKKPAQRKATPVIVKVGLIVFIWLVIYWGYAVFYPRKLPEPYRLAIQPQEPIIKLAYRLQRDGIISSPRLFVVVARLMRRDRQIIAGLYILKHSFSLVELVTRLSNGKPDAISITLLEGWNFNQVRQHLNAEANLNHLTLSMSEAQILATLKIAYPRMEGWLYPATYFIAPQQSDLEVMQLAYKTMQVKLAKAWASKNSHANNYHDPYQLLIMASLIQKETNDQHDMYQIASVFNNRMRLNMRLQDDPAVFYGLANRNKITRADFQLDTPYNTYLHAGLPPTPICLPSQAALLAASSPESDDKLLYFIAIGSGKSKFSYSYQEHRAAVAKYLKKSAATK